LNSQAKAKEQSFLVIEFPLFRQCELPPTRQGHSSSCPFLW